MSDRKLTRGQLIKLIAKYTQALASDRDELRKLLEPAQEILEDCDDALSSLEYAIETLSRNV